MFKELKTCVEPCEKSHNFAHSNSNDMCCRELQNISIKKHPQYYRTTFLEKTCAPTLINWIYTITDQCIIPTKISTCDFSPFCYYSFSSVLEQGTQKTCLLKCLASHAGHLFEERHYLSGPAKNRKSARKSLSHKRAKFTRQTTIYYVHIYSIKMDSAGEKCFF